MGKDIHLKDWLAEKNQAEILLLTQQLWGQGYSLVRKSQV